MMFESNVFVGFSISKISNIITMHINDTQKSYVMCSKFDDTVLFVEKNPLKSFCNNRPVDKVLELFVFVAIARVGYLWDIKGPLSIFNRNFWVDTIHFTCPQSLDGIRNITVTNDNILFDLFVMFLTIIEFVNPRILCLVLYVF